MNATSCLRGLRVLGLAIVAMPCIAGVSATPQEAALTGIWQLASPVGAQLKDAQGKAPPLNAAGQKLYAERSAQLARGDKNFDLTEKCKPMGFPRTLWDGAPFDMQVVTGKAVFQGYTYNRNHRLLVTWDAKLPPLQIARYYGTSAAHWEGSTLVVRSGLYNANSILDRSGLPVSENLTIVERYTPSKDGNTMSVRLTLDDDTFFTRPWDVKVNFKRVPDGLIVEDVCEERSPFYRDLLKSQR